MDQNEFRESHLRQQGAVWASGWFLRRIPLGSMKQPHDRRLQSSWADIILLITMIRRQGVAGFLISAKAETS